MTTPLFRQALVTPGDLSANTAAIAIARYKEEEGHYPTVLWTTPDEYFLGWKITHPEGHPKMIVKDDYSYPPGAWSVGTENYKGWGSEGV